MTKYYVLLSTEDNDEYSYTIDDVKSYQNYVQEDGSAVYIFRHTDGCSTRIPSGDVLYITPLGESYHEVTKDGVLTIQRPRLTEEWLD